MDNTEKFNKWLSKAIRGEKGYCLLSCGNDGWNYQLEAQQGAVTSLAVCIWENDQIHVYHKWDGKEPADTSKRILAVVKDESKLMVAVEGVGLFPFSSKDDQQGNCKAVLFVQCDWYSTVISATNAPAAVQVQSYVQDGIDPLSAIFSELFDHLAANCSGKEAVKDAGEVGPSIDVNMG